MRKYFIKDFNILHSGKSYRSYGIFKHIHIVDEGEYMFVHQDYENLARFLPLAILHFFCDVLPYIILAFAKQVPLEALFRKPE